MSTEYSEQQPLTAEPTIYELIGGDENAVREYEKFKEGFGDLEDEWLAKKAVSHFVAAHEGIPRHDLERDQLISEILSMLISGEAPMPQFGIKLAPRTAIAWAALHDVLINRIAENAQDNRYTEAQNG